MKRLISSKGALGALFATVILAMSACGGGEAAATGTTPQAFPNANNYPTLNIADRVVNLGSRTGYQYAKLTVAVVFQDTKGDFGKAKGDALKKLQDGFTADNIAVVQSFNDVITTDISQKTAEDLQSAAGKENLRQQLIKDFNARLAGPPQVLWVEFVDFVMQ